MNNSDFLKQLQQDFADVSVTQDTNDLSELDVLDVDLASKDFSINKSDATILNDTDSKLESDIVEPDSSLDDLDDVVTGDVITSGDTTEIFASPDVFNDNANSSNLMLADDISTPLSFDFEQMSDALASTELMLSNTASLEVEEQTIANQQINECTELGFAIPEDFDVDQIDDLHSYAVATTQNINYYEAFAQNYLGMTSKLANSSALHVDQHDSTGALRASLLKCTANPEMSQIFSRASALVSAKVTSLLNTKSQFDIKPSDIDADEIFIELINNASFDKTYNVSMLQLKSEEITEYINTAIAAWTSNVVNDAISTLKDSTRRENSALVLTKEAFEVTKELSNNNYAFIKHIDAVNGGNIQCTCSKCGKKTKVSSLMHFIYFFEGSSKISRYVYPALNKCECGALLIFPLSAYVTASDAYSKANSHNIHAMMDTAKGFGAGSTVLTVSPSLEQLPPMLTSIVTNVEMDVIGDKQQVTEVHDSEEWRLAVKDFYKRVKLLNGKTAAKIQLTNLQNEAAKDSDDETSDLVSSHAANYDVKIPNVFSTDNSFLSLMAANTAQIAGVNYNTVKGKALASLINFLQSNSVISKMISFDSVMSENAALKLVEEYSTSNKLDLNKFDHNVSNNLMMIAAQLDPSFEEPSDKNEICKFLHEHLAELRNRVSSVNEMYSEFIEELESSKYSLACLPIVDYNQVPIYSIMQFMPNEQLFVIINEICDRMILNHFSGEYFEYWCRFDLQHTANLKRRLLTVADTQMISNAINDVVSDVFSAYGVTATDHYRQNVCAQSLQKWDLLKKLADILASGNYYRFCKEALNVPEDNYGFGAPFNALISEFRHKNYVEFSRVTIKSEVQFYLGDMFTAEELSSNSDLFEYLVFGRYVPIRQENETPEQYVGRFKSSSATSIGCIDNHALFRNIKKLYSIVFGSAFSLAKYKNIRVSNFIAFMLDSVISTQSLDSLELIGLSTLRCSTLLQQIHPWHFSDFNLNNADIVALINGYYFLNTDTAITNVFGTMTNSYFAATDKLIPLNQIFSFDDALSSELQNVVNSAEGTDLAEMINELSFWEYTPGYTERFSAE